MVQKTRWRAGADMERATSQSLRRRCARSSTTTVLVGLSCDAYGACATVHPMDAQVVASHGDVLLSEELYLTHGPRRTCMVILSRRSPAARLVEPFALTSQTW